MFFSFILSLSLICTQQVYFIPLVFKCSRNIFRLLTPRKIILMWHGSKSTLAVSSPFLSRSFSQPHTFLKLCLWSETLSLYCFWLNFHALTCFFSSSSSSSALVSLRYFHRCQCVCCSCTRFLPNQRRSATAESNWINVQTNKQTKNNGTKRIERTYTHSAYQLRLSNAKFITVKTLIYSNLLHNYYFTSCISIDNACDNTINPFHFLKQRHSYQAFDSSLLFSLSSSTKWCRFFRVLVYFHSFLIFGSSQPDICL